MGILGILTIVFIVLKLINVITWSWWLVLLPGIIEIVFIIINYYYCWHTGMQKIGEKENE
jgi:hypothetical protein